MKHINFIEFLRTKCFDTSRPKCVDSFLRVICIGNIGTVWDKKLCMKIGYNSKVFVIVVDYSCVIFKAQNVLIPPNQTLSMPLDQNVLILLVSNT